MEGYSTASPAAAVPVRTKIPVPMMAPMPRQVRLTQPSDFFNRRSGASASEINWSMFLTRNSPEPTRHHPNAKQIENRANSTLRGLAPQLPAWPPESRCVQRRSQKYCACSGPAQIRIPLHEFLRSVIGETHGQFAVVAIALDAGDGSGAVCGMAHALADERIRIGAPDAARRGRTRSDWRFGIARGRGGSATHS